MRLLLFLPLLLFGASLGWQSNYEQARKIATKQHKVLMIFFENHHCKWCQKMLDTTLSDPTIVAKLSKLVIPVRVYKEKKNYPKTITSKYTPTIFFLDENDRPIIRPILGYWEKESFLFYIKDLERALAKRKQN